MAVALTVGDWKYADNLHRYGTPLFAKGSAGDAFSTARECRAPLASQCS